jgi:DEAD/DEAH box helicase domain-containing protein
MAPGVLVLDEAKADDDAALHLAWRHWLHLFNTTQSLSGMWLATENGLDHKDYDGLSPSPAPKAVQPTEQTSLNGAWLETFDQLLDPLKPGMVRLAQAGAAVPEIGTELADDKGRVVADAEIIWAAAYVAILRSDQADMAEAWTVQGWTVLCLDEGLTQCMAQPWEATVATALGLTIGNQE